MILYKIDILKALAEKGYSCNRMRKENILSESTMQSIREGRNITTKTINTICLILECQPSDILEVITTDEEKQKYLK